MATYVIGDVQGCFESLQALLAQIDFEVARDRLWFVGDLVNRGPQSLEVLRFVRQLGDRAVTVLGNHDLHLLMQAEGFGRSNPEDSLAPILAAPDRQGLLDWLRHRPLLYREGVNVMVHAGLLPGWTLRQAESLAGEVEAALRAENYREFLAHMRGSTPESWDDGLTGWDRLRVVVNALTRMRFCKVDGRLDFASKGPADGAPEGSQPWFSFPRPADEVAPYRVLCGHWSALGLYQQPGLTALDTGCLWGGALTAYRLEDGALFQRPCPVSCPPSGWD